MAHGSEIVDLVRLGFLNDPDEITGVAEVAVMKVKPGILNVRIFVDVIDPGGIEETGPALDAMDGVAFLEEKFSEVGTILAGDSCNEGGLHDRV
jgi:hypothetical protein